MLTRRSFLAVGGLSLLAGCKNGHLNILGYTTQPNYDPSIKSIHVPIFSNKVFQTTPYRGMEIELTRAVIREIEQVTPFKIQGDPSKADTELLGQIVTLNKILLNRTQQNEVREAELTLGVQLVWRDLRTQQILSNPTRARIQDVRPFDPQQPELPDAPDKPVPVLVTSAYRFLPEVGESNATAQTRLCNQLAKQIVALLEKRWELPANCPTPAT